MSKAKNAIEKIIYDNFEVIDDIIDELKQQVMDGEIDYLTVEDLEDDNKMYSEACEQLDDFYDITKRELEDFCDTDNKIVAIANMGLWNGRCMGYKVLTSVSDILSCCECDYMKVYFDGYNIKGEYSHHDGTHYITFRVMKDDDKLDVFTDKIYHDELTSRQISYYTESLANYIAPFYGWGIRGKKKEK